MASRLLLTLTILLPLAYWEGVWVKGEGELACMAGNVCVLLHDSHELVVVVVRIPSKQYVLCIQVTLCTHCEERRCLV